MRVTRGRGSESDWSCFCCLDPVKTNIHTISLVSMGNLCRYLKINSDNPAIPGSIYQNMKTEDGSEVEATAAPFSKYQTDVKVSVSLCAKCTSLWRKFSELFRLWEEIGMKMDSYLETVKKSLDASKRGSKSITSKKIQFRVEPRVKSNKDGSAEADSLLEAAPVDVLEPLRQLVLQKCEIRSSQFTPKVRLEREKARLQDSIISTYEESQMPQYLDRLAEMEDQDDLLDSDPMNEGFSDDGFQDPMEEPSSSIRSPTPPSLPIRRSRLMRKRKFGKNPSKRWHGYRPDFSIITDNDNKKEKRFKCNICDTVCPDRVSFYRHHNLQHITTAAECEICGKVLNCRGALTQHKARVHQPRILSKRHRPVIIKKSNPTVTPKRYTFNKETNLYKCAKCDVEVSNMGSIYEHYNVTHLGANLPCKFCSRMFLNKKKLEKHESKCVCQTKLEILSNPQTQGSSSTSVNGLSAGVTDNKILLAVPGLHCNICNKTFSTHSSRLHHHRTVHVKQRDHICDICGKSYMSNSHLRSHKRNIHSERNFNCEECGKHFSSQTTLQVHRRFVHTQAHPGYTCELCGKNFRQRNHCREHQEADHFNLRYTCYWPNCGNKSFKLKRVFKKHLRNAHQVVEIMEEHLETARGNGYEDPHQY